MDSGQLNLRWQCQVKRPMKEDFHICQEQQMHINKILALDPDKCICKEPVELYS